jgi:hypothetical protein
MERLGQGALGGAQLGAEPRHEGVVVFQRAEVAALGLDRLPQYRHADEVAFDTGREVFERVAQLGDGLAAPLAAPVEGGDDLPDADVGDPSARQLRRGR